MTIVQVLPGRHRARDKEVNKKYKSGWVVVLHTFIPSTWKAEAGRSL